MKYDRTSVKKLFNTMVLKCAHPMLRAYWKVFKPKTNGVKTAIRNADGQLLLIRNTYGSKTWNLPGGGFKPRKQTLEEAATREIREELQISIHDARELFVYESRAEAKKDRIICLEAYTDTQPSPSTEIREAQFFNIVSLPSDISTAVIKYVDWAKSNSQN